MHIFYLLADWQAYRKSIDSSTKIGFVPTMGNLHRGHISLVEAAYQANDIVVASIFINPTQFNHPDDFKHYPRTLAQDFKQLEAAGVEAVIVPDYEALYADDYRYQIHETKTSTILEGRHRPGHFNGVLTIVMKLFNLVKPTNAYFGEKDNQQFQLLKDMAEAFFMDLGVHMCPTVREDSGLAMSSRNNRLTSTQKQEAETFARCFLQKDKNCDAIKQEMEAMGFKVDYVEEHNQRRYAAAYVGEIRLIDTYECVSS